jgi:hypothetical protein
MKKKILLMVVVFFLSVIVTGFASAAGPNAKCGTAMSFTFLPGLTVSEGTSVTMTEEITVTSQGSGNQDCELEVSDPVYDGNAMIQAVMLGDQGLPCDELGNKYCTTGTSEEPDNSCSVNDDCVTDPSGNGICEEVALTKVAQENPTDGSLDYTLNTTELGGQVLGFKASYEGQRNFDKTNPICTDLTVVVQECTWIEETAWAEGLPYNIDGKGNWATYTFYDNDSGFGVPLIAGQTMEAGTVQFSEPEGGYVTITIELNQGWRFKDTAENVKIQDYDSPPSGNPSIGLFDWKGYATGSSYTVLVPENFYYGVHVDVERCEAE